MFSNVHRQARIVALLGLLFVLPLCWFGCSDDDDGGTKPPPVSGTIIDENGGTVESKDGIAQLTIPAGALPGDVTFEIIPCDTCPAGPLAGTVYTCLPEDQQFDSPATLAIGYDPNLVPAGRFHIDLRLATLSGGAWLGLAGSAVDSVNHTVSCARSHLSTYGVTVGGGEVTSRTVYVLDDPTPGAEDEFDSLTAALAYLNEQLAYEDLGTVVIQTSSPQQVSSLAFDFDLVMQVDGIAVANISGPGALPLVVDAGGALQLGRIVFTNAGGLVLNANRNLTVDGCGLPDGTAINFGGVKGAPYPAAEPGFLGKRGASVRAMGATFSGNTHGPGFTVNWSGGADASGAYGFANNSGPDAGFGGQSGLSAAGSLELQSNGWGILNVGVKLSGNASLDVSGHENLTSFDFSPRLEDGNHNLQLRSNTTATFTAGIAGLGEAAFTVNQSTTNGSSSISFDSPRIAFASNGSSWSDILFNLGASYLANPEYDFNLAGGLLGGAVTIGAPDAPGGQVTLDISELTVMGDVAFSLNWRVFVEFDNVTLQGHVSAGIEGSLHKFDSFKTKYQGGLDLLFQGGSLSANIQSRQDEFSEYSRILPPPVFGVTLTLTDAVIYDYASLEIAGSQKTNGIDKDGGEVIIEGGNYFCTGSSIALQIHDLGVPVTIRGVTFEQKSGMSAPLNLAELSESITIDDCNFRGSGITINDCGGAATITNNDMIIDQPMGWGISSLSSPGATITDNTIICTSAAAFAITDSAERGAGTISGNTVDAATSNICIWIPGGSVNITDNTMVAGRVTIYGQVLFANNTCSSCELHDLNFDGGLLADPMEMSNSGLTPDMIYTHCDWDDNGCCDYPPANNERVDGVCICEGVSPPAPGK